MESRQRLIAFGLSFIATVTVILATLMSTASGFSQIIITVGSMIPLVSLVVGGRDPIRIVPDETGKDPGGNVAAVVSPSHNDDRATFEAWREQACQSLEDQGRQLDLQRQQLNDRLLRYREFLEYPANDSPETSNDVLDPELSEKDREVNRILETEAARIYEKIRADGYRSEDQLNLSMIREEVFDIIQRVARVYSPDSAHPVMETSFDQLARAASRTCLQALVLVEQLPLDVQHYTISELYNYVRKAVTAWGAWQTVSPWMTRLGRGIYAGRIAAGASPLTLGAWWVASELGRRGSKKLIENYVDQRAVAFFSDAVRLIGNEVAAVYGPGLRQRDPAWAYGAELTELHHRFPPSRDSLQAGLREITSLPLRSEYDRIYLYRCLAEHKASGLRVTDPTVLTRDERENIAGRLEQFFQKHIHGACDADVERWRTSVEDHLDIRLSPASVTFTPDPSVSLRAVLRAVYMFLTDIGGLEQQKTLDTIQSSRLYSRLSPDEASSLCSELRTDDVSVFEPPELDPSDPMTSEFLDDLIDCCVRVPLPDAAVESLLMETGRYFRQGAEETRQQIANAWMQQLGKRTLPDVSMSRKVPVPARQLLRLMESEEQVSGIYHDIELEPSSLCNGVEMTELWLAVLTRDGRRRVLLLTSAPESEVLWKANDDFKTERMSGIVIDDCIISGGQWTDHTASGTIILSGKFGTVFESRFAPLLS
ncbi:MAG: hypothetical protein MK110_10340 [Fuerstiella sp.]|nr:hypothetical protein [Fuerstiella sp.]